MNPKLSFLLILTACLFQTVFGQDTMSESQAQKGYLLGPGDVVKGAVLNEKEFDFVSTVDEDGRIQVPFFEQGVLAKCRTEKELRADVSQLLSKYLRNPQVQIQVTERNSRPPVTVYGEVKQQQQIVLTRRTQLLELISFAGGVTEEAGGLIQVFRTRSPMCGDATEENSWKTETSDGLDVPSRVYSLSSLRQGRDEANPIILPGDIIVVQKAAPVYFVGEVRQPTGVLLKEGGLSLSQALAMVGGVNREAKTKDIKIHRLKPGSKDRDIIAVNYDLISKREQKDIMLEPYDIIEVDKAKKSITQTILEIAIGAGRGGVTAVTQGLGTRILY